MKTKIIKIGNSKGIRLPKVLLQQTGIRNEVDLNIEDGKIILEPVRKKRNGWSEAFKEMAKNSDDRLLDQDETLGQTSWDDEEWTW